MEEEMNKTKLHIDTFRAALRTEERRMKELLDAIELNDVSQETVVEQIRQIEDGLRRIRQAA
jgi:hypothetical protein